MAWLIDKRYLNFKFLRETDFQVPTGNNFK